MQKIINHIWRLNISPAFVAAFQCLFCNRIGQCYKLNYISKGCFVFESSSMIFHRIYVHNCFIGANKRCFVKWPSMLGVLLIITMTSWWARWRLKSPALRLFTQRVIQAQINENIKALCHWPFWGEFTGGRWIPYTAGQQRRKGFHLMTSSWLQWPICPTFSQQLNYCLRILMV